MNTLAKRDIVKNIFGDSFLLDSRVSVDSLEAGARAYGGCTQVGFYTYSNIDSGQPIELYEKGNIYGIIVPSTINVNEAIDNEEFVQYVNRKMSIVADTEICAGAGSWYSEDLDEVIVENNKIITMVTDMDPSVVLQYMRLIALNLKDMMNQEGVSIIINDGLVIV